MARFRLFKPFTSFFTDQGTLNTGGYFRFFETGTSTPKDVYDAPEAGTNLGSEVDIDVSGRPEDDIWGEGVYRVRMYDENDVLQDEFDNVQAEAPDDDILPDPAGNAGKTLVSDGAAYVLEDISGRLLPDPTGHADEFVTTDGETYSLAPIEIPEAPELDLSAAGLDFNQSEAGSVTTASYSDRSASVNVTYAKDWDEAPEVYVTVTSGPHSAAGNQPTVKVTNKTTTGCAITFTLSELDDADAEWDFNSNVTADWRAFGMAAE